MSKTIMIGCDLHDRTMLLRAAAGKGKAVERSFSNERLGRGLMLDWMEELKKKHRAKRVVFAYEASG